jgi:hypothetical protein
VDHLTLLKVQTKLSAATITMERIDAGHPEDICEWDQKDWEFIVGLCTDEAQVYLRFEEWTARVNSYETKRKGLLH